MGRCRFATGGGQKNHDLLARFEGCTGFDTVPFGDVGWTEVVALGQTGNAVAFTGAHGGAAGDDFGGQCHLAAVCHPACDIFAHGG